MTTEAILPPPSKPFEWFEEKIHIRGCRLSLSNIAEAYSELNDINLNVGKQEIEKLVRPEGVGDDEWQKHKEYVFGEAFRLTVTITGQQDLQLYGDTVDVFSSKKLPLPIKQIYFTNETAFKGQANGNAPRDLFRISLDFDKPSLVDTGSFVSDPTPNGSNAFIQSEETMFFRAVQNVVNTKLRNHKTWYSFLHASFVYDIGLWLVALPLALYFSTHYMDVFIPKYGTSSSYRWAFFVYSIGMMLVGYRVLNAYSKWAFPVNVLVENNDKATKHRLLLGGMLCTIGYKIVDTFYQPLFAWLGNFLQ